MKQSFDEREDFRDVFEEQRDYPTKHEFNKVKDAVLFLLGALLAHFLGCVLDILIPLLKG